MVHVLAKSFVRLSLMLHFLTVSNTCPTNCTCFTSFNYVACTGQTFSTIPDNIPNDTETLKLVHNELFELHLPKLYHLNELQVLDVRGNGISTILGSFEKFSSLRQVYLGENNISTISPETFGNTFQKLAYIDLTGNPFNCQCPSVRECDECDILWLKRQVHINPDRVGRKVLCQNPVDLRGQFLDKVKIPGPKCEHDGYIGNYNSITLDLNVLSIIVHAATGLSVILALVMFVHKTRNWARKRKQSLPVGRVSSVVFVIGHGNDGYLTDDVTQRTSRQDNDRNDDDVVEPTDEDMTTVDTDTKTPHVEETHSAIAEHPPPCSAPSNHNTSRPPEVVSTVERRDSNPNMEPKGVVDDDDVFTQVETDSALILPNELEERHRESHRYRTSSLSTSQVDVN